MATTVTKVIDPDSGTGYDYDSWFDWEAAQQGDLTGVRDEIAVAKCRCTAGTADSTAVTIDGWTTSATQYIKVWTDTAESYRHSGKYETGNKYRIAVSTEGTIITNNESYTRIEGIIAYNSFSTSGDYNPRIIDDTAGNARFGFLIIKGYPNGPWYPQGIRLGVNSIVYNSIVQDIIRSSTSWGLGVDRQDAVNGTRAYNVTAYNCYYGFYTYDDGVTADNQMVLKNCIAASCTDGFFAAWQWGTGTNYNASTLAADAPGANSRNSQTFTFVNSSGGDFHLQATDAGALGYGLNLYNDAAFPFQTDIDNQDRGGSGATWDIGADEYVSAVSDLSINVADCVSQVIQIGGR